jgi:RNA polymerase sigma-70 factor (ECF subfamily)
MSQRDSEKPPEVSAVAPQLYSSPHSLSAGECLDPELLQETQAYLQCRFRRQAHADVSIKSWERFYGICDSLIRCYARAFNVPRADLKDLVQEVWTELLKSLRYFSYDRERGRFSSWLYRVVQSKAIDLLRRRTRHPTVTITLQSQRQLESREEDPAMACERSGQREHVQRVLREMRHQVSPRNYCLFHLRWIEGRSMREIGTMLGLTPEQVRFRQHRLKRKFRVLYRLDITKDFSGQRIRSSCSETRRNFLQLAQRPRQLCGS